MKCIARRLNKAIIIRLLNLLFTLLYTFKRKTHTHVVHYRLYIRMAINESKLQGKIIRFLIVIKIMQCIVRIYFYITTESRSRLQGLLISPYTARLLYSAGQGYH